MIIMQLAKMNKGCPKTVLLSLSQLKIWRHRFIFIMELTISIKIIVDM